MLQKFVLAIAMSLISFFANAQYNSTVTKDGSGNYSTVQAAIDNAPTNSATPYVIYIANGRYYEKVNIPSNKPNIQLIGQSVSGVIIFYDDYAGKPITGGGTLGTQNSASVTINAVDFVAVNITFENSFKYDSASAAGVTGLQAVAITVNADRCAFKNCRFIGMQDTLYTKGSGNPRHYFYKCYIDGIVDFIFGSSIAIFDSCSIYPKSRITTGNSYITAANTTTGQAYGYWFKDCNLYNNTGNTTYFLGRPWSNATAGITAANKTVFTNCKMSASINPLGWSTWDAGTNTSVISYAEYKSKKFDGSLIDVSNRVAWSKQFTNADTVGYNILNVFNGWNPCGVRLDFCTNPTTELAVSNFKSIKNGSNSNLSWNASFPLTGVTYNLYRSTNNKASFQVIYSNTAINDTAINFANTDAFPPSCSKYYYVVEAVKAGYNTTKTDTIEVSAMPVINTSSNSLTNFIQDMTGPGTAQSFTISAINLVNNVTLIPPANFEISKDNIAWVNNTSSLTLSQSAGVLASTIIYVRLNAVLPSNYSGDLIINTLCNTTTISKAIALSGAKQSTTIVYYNVIQQWDLTTNNADNATIRIPELQATTPVFSRFALSIATTPANYTTLFGQSFAATGNGSWSTGVGGPGGNLNRTFYEEFTVKPTINNQARIDSIVVNSAFYGTTSNTKLAVVYSKNNFTIDSFNVTGGRDLSGVNLPSNANGAFTTPIVLLNQTAGTTAEYALALNASNGVTLNTGDSLKIRLYYSCGSTSAGRYAMLKNVRIKGTTPRILPLKFKYLTASQTPPIEGLMNRSIKLNWTTENEINVSHFNIMRSVDGKGFINIGKVDAGKNEYSYTDYSLPLTVNGKLLTYYRIEAVDKDGTKTYSETKLVNSQQLIVNSLVVFPNPAKNTVIVNANNAKQISLVDITGKVIFASKTNQTQTIINTSTYSKGIYIVKVLMNDGNIVNKKLIIE